MKKVYNNNNDDAVGGSRSSKAELTSVADAPSSLPPRLHAVPKTHDAAGSCQQDLSLCATCPRRSSSSSMCLSLDGDSLVRATCEPVAPHNRTVVASGFPRAMEARTQLTP